MKTTIYIPKDKWKLYEQLKKEFRGNISALFVRTLERELERITREKSFDAP